MARHVYRNGVTIDFQAAIVAAANGGGAGSVIGDTTTTMMWISGIGALQLAPAIIGAIAAFAFFAPLTTLQQQRRSPISRGPSSPVHIDWARVVIVWIILAAIIAVNVIGNSFFPEPEKIGPALGIGLWIAILATAAFRAPDWRVLIEATKGATFLVVLVALASLNSSRQTADPISRQRLRVGNLVGCVRQHPAHRACSKSRWLRLGAARLRGGLRRLDTVVRFFGRGGSHKYFSGRPISHPMAA
jgi:hypothetical protein